MTDFPQTIKPFAVEDTSSALYKHGKSMDEAPLLFSAKPVDSDDSLGIRQSSGRDYEVSGSFFQTKSHSGKLESPEKSNSTDLLFITIVIVPLLLSLWMIRVAFTRIQGAYRAAFNDRYASIFIRNFSLGNHISTYIIFFNSVLAISVTLWLWLLNNNYVPTGAENEALLAILLCFVGYFLYRYFVIYIAKIIYLTNDSTEQYLFRDYYITTIISTLLPFLLFAIAFSPFANILWHMTIGLMALLQAYRILLSLYTGILERTYGLFYFILYFCTVEIVPVAIILKLITERISL